MSKTTVRLNMLLCLLFISIGLMGCNGPSPRRNALPPPALSAAQSWIKKRAIVLTTTNQQATLDDLSPLKALVGTDSLVGLGEATHGSNVNFTMNHRLRAFLDMM